MRRRRAGRSRRLAVASSVAEQGDQAAAGRLGDTDQFQQGGFARARKPGQEGERSRLQREADIAQHFGAGAIAHADIFEADHAARPDIRMIAVSGSKRICGSARGNFEPDAEHIVTASVRPLSYFARYFNWPGMILTCPSCGTRYSVDGAKFPSQGRTVRCAKCGHSWHQAPEAEPEPEAVRDTPPPAPSPDAAPGAVPGPAPDPVPDPVAASSTRAYAPRGSSGTAARAPWPQAGRGGGLDRPDRRGAADRRFGVRYRQDIAMIWPQSAGVYSSLGLKVNASGIDFQAVGYKPRNRGRPDGAGGLRHHRQHRLARIAGAADGAGDPQRCRQSRTLSLDLQAQRHGVEGGPVGALHHPAFQPARRGALIWKCASPKTDA